MIAKMLRGTQMSRHTEDFRQTILISVGSEQIPRDGFIVVEK